MSDAGFPSVERTTNRERDLQRQLNQAKDRIKELEAALGQVGHVAQFTDDGRFATEHPIECRGLPGGLASCEVHRKLAELAQCPVEEPGRYWVLMDHNGDPVIGEKL